MRYYERFIKNASYRPQFEFHADVGKLREDLFFGFEMEVVAQPSWTDHLYFLDPEENVRITKLYNYLKKLNKEKTIFYCKKDASCGIEINSHPFNWNWLENHRKMINDFLLQLNSWGFEVDTNCGFHIHVNREYFTNLHLIKMLYLFHYFDTFIHKVSQRSKNSLSRWADCYKADIKNVQNLPSKNYSELFERFADMGKYSSLNLDQKDTVEIRIFRGTINPYLISAYLEFCLGCVLYTKTTKLSEISIEHLKKYFCSNSERYSYAIKLINYDGNRKSPLYWKNYAEIT